jgi:hypothetical protein
VQLRIGSTAVLLDGDTEIEALRLDDQRLQFQLQRGRMALRLRSPEVAAETEVLQPEARLLPRQVGMYRIERVDGTSDVEVMQGALGVEGHNLWLSLHAGQRAAFWRDGPLGDTRNHWLVPQQDAFAQAVQAFDRTDAPAAHAGIVPPEMTGVEDLDRHGRWSQHPELGAVWSPMSLPSGWVPYRYGQWVWLRPWGWTWVDDAPWGFAPFHYGRWLWWGNRWCWSPGPLVPRPVFAPALVAWVGGPQFSIVIGSRPTPAWGWVALGPREVYTPGYRASPGHLRRLNPHLPAGPLPPPTHVNRGVPGAVTVLPTPGFAPRQPVGAAALRGDDLLRGAWPATPFQARGPERPERPPPRRETVAPRVAMPAPAVAPISPIAPTAPTAPVAPVAPIDAGRDATPLRPAPSHGMPPSNPRPETVRPAPSTAAAPAPRTGPAGAGPFGGRPVPNATTPRAELERPPTPAVPAPPAPARTGQPSPQPPPQAAAPARAMPSPAAPAPNARPMPSPETPSQAVVPVARPAAPPVVTPAAPVPPARPADAAVARPAADPGERRRTPESRQPGRER